MLFDQIAREGWEWGKKSKGVNERRSAGPSFGHVEWSSRRVMAIGDGKKYGRRPSIYGFPLPISVS